MKYFITGATGHLGSALVDEMSTRIPASDIHLGIHDISKDSQFVGRGLQLGHVDYSDKNMLTAAFWGCDTVIFIPANDPDSFHAVHDLEHLIYAAKRASVSRIISVGFIADQLNNPFFRSAYFGYLPRRLAEETDFDWTIVRTGLYAYKLADDLPFVSQSGILDLPMGKDSQAPLSFITVKDVAHAITDLALHPREEDNRQTYTLTQERSYTPNELAHLLSAVVGQPVEYHPAKPEQYIARLKQSAVTADHAELSASLYKAGSMGLLGEITSDYEKLTGNKPQTLEDYLATR